MLLPVQDGWQHDDNSTTNKRNRIWVLLPLKLIYKTSNLLHYTQNMFYGQTFSLLLLLVLKVFSYKENCYIRRETLYATKRDGYLQLDDIDAWLESEFPMCGSRQKNDLCSLKRKISHKTANYISKGYTEFDTMFEIMYPECHQVAQPPKWFGLSGLHLQLLPCCLHA